MEGARGKTSSSIRDMRVEPGWIFGGVKAFAFVGCMFYFPLDFPWASRLNSQ